jgi:hypothetical protein
MSATHPPQAGCMQSLLNITFVMKQDLMVFQTGRYMHSRWKRKADPQPGYMVGGRQESVKRLPDDNASFSAFGNSGWAAYPYSIDPNNPDDTFKPMPRVATHD